MRLVGQVARSVRVNDCQAVGEKVRGAAARSLVSRTAT